MIVNRLAVIISFFCAIMLFIVSTGFDLYSHAVSYYFYDYIINASDIFYGLVLPRYLLLSYIYEISSRLGIPIGFVALALIVYPVYHSISSISTPNISTKTKIGKDRSNYISLINFIVIYTFLLLSFFYSGLSLTIIWLISLLITKNKFFLLGVLFHPVGIILGLFLIIIFRSYWLRYISILVIFAIFLYIMRSQEYFTASKYMGVRYNLSEVNIQDLLTLIFINKSNEIFGLLTFSFLIFILHSRFKYFLKFLHKIYFPRVFLFFTIIVVLFSLNFYFYFKQRNTFILNTLSLNISDPIYATWYDWGNKDLTDHPVMLYMKRY